MNVSTGSPGYILMLNTYFIPFSTVEEMYLINTKHIPDTWVRSYFDFQHFTALKNRSLSMEDQIHVKMCFTGMTKFFVKVVVLDTWMAGFTST